MTSSSEEIPMKNGDRTSKQSVENDKRFLIRQQLYYLFHAFRCTRLAYTAGQGDCQNQHCIMMRGVVKHITKCQLGKECTFQHCPSSKEIIKHWKHCNDIDCQVCAPLRRNNNGVKKDDVESNIGKTVLLNCEQTSGEKYLHDINWRNQIYRIRPIFLAQLTDELLPVKVCEDVKNHPGYSEVNNYVKRFEIEVFQNTQSLNEYFYKLAERFEFVYRSLLAKYRLKDNENSVIISPAISRFENTHIQIEAFFRLIKSKFEKIYANYGASSDALRIRKEDISVKEEGITEVVDEHVDKLIPEIISSTCRILIKQEAAYKSSSNSTNTSPLKISHSAPVAIESKMSPDSTSVPKKEISAERQTWTHADMMKMFIPIYEELFDDKESEPFKFPVDWKLLDIPDYPTIVKHPMDLSTISEKLLADEYRDPWEVVDDFWLMFNNAWLYNKKTSKVYKMCSSLAKIFESKIDDVMTACGFCCGRDHVYLPQVLICCTPNVCLIVRDSVYYAFQNDNSNGDKIISDLTCDKYICCEKCFTESVEEVQFINPENNAAPCNVQKTLLTKCRNNIKENEEFVYCRLCSRKWHKVCGNYLEEIVKEGFACPSCVRGQSIKIRTNIFKSKSLPQNHLSRHLENRVNSFLKDKDPSVNEIVIRVLSSSDKVVEVKSGMKSHYCETCEMPETFKYRLKAIFAFQEIDGQEICFFGLHVQEYGSDCPDPNSRRVYVAYLDSVHYFTPRKYRTDVYHEFLIGYLEYVKKIGYTMAHIWACPPGEGDDYIFHMHPSEQRLPKPKRLQEWYIKMLDIAMKENIVIEYKDIFSDALQSNMLSPTELPYFDGDYWPNALEEIFKEIDDESNKRRSIPDSNSQEVDNPKREITSKNDLSKMDKKPKKRKLKRMVPLINKRKRNSGSETMHDVSRRVLELIEKRKENFFVIRLHTQIDAANLPDIIDPDPLMNSDLMDGRDKFLCLAREKHLEFSSLRRAKYSTLVFCYELHQEHKSSALFTCNACNKQMDARYTCKQCEDFELCPACFKIESHCHPLYRINPEEGCHSLSNSCSTIQPTSELQDTYRAQMVRYSQSLQHACQCRDVNCRLNFCAKMKGMIKHLSCCSLPKNTCKICQPFLRICCVHAKFCNDTKCHVPNCLALRFAWKQQGSQQRMQQAQLLRRRVALMQRGVSSDPIPVSIPNVQPQAIEVTSQCATSMIESNVGMQSSSKSLPFVNQMEPSHIASYNNVSSSLSATEIKVTDDDIRVVLQQYSIFQQNYPLKEDFQNHFGSWLNSSPKLQLAFDILLKRSKRPPENPGVSHYQGAPPREFQTQKSGYSHCAQPHWVHERMSVVPYSQSYTLQQPDPGLNTLYDYRPAPGHPSYLPAPVHPSYLPAPGHPSYVPVPGHPSYVPAPAHGHPSYLPMSYSEAVRMSLMPKMPYLSRPLYMSGYPGSAVPRVSLQGGPMHTVQHHEPCVDDAVVKSCGGTLAQRQQQYLAFQYPGSDKYGPHQETPSGVHYGQARPACSSSTR